MQALSYINGVISRDLIDRADGDTLTRVYDTTGQLQTLTFEDGSETRDWASYTNTYDETGAVIDTQYIWDI